MSSKPASANQLKLWKKLLMRKYRKREKLFLAEGVRCVEQIIKNGTVSVREIIVETSQELPLEIPQRLPVYTLNADDFSSISDTNTPQGIIAVCEIPEEPSLSDISQEAGIIAAFDAIQDPGNLGTMIRTASWFGVSALIAGTGTVDPWHPKVVRSTAGATGTIPLLCGNLQTILSELESTGWETLLLDLNPKATTLQDTNTPDKTIFVVGNEANGISSALKTNSRQPIFISGNSITVESLNAAVAFGISLCQLNK